MSTTPYFSVFSEREFEKLNEQNKEKKLTEFYISRYYPELMRWITRFNQCVSVREREIATNIILALVADMQTGKGECSALVEHVMFIVGRDFDEPRIVCHMVKQVAHEKDYLRACDRHNQKWKEFNQKMGTDFPGIQCVSVADLKIKDHVLKEDKNLRDIKETIKMTNNSNTIIICQAGPTQMKKLRLLLDLVEGNQEYRQHKFILFDESHSTTQWRRGTDTGADLDKITKLDNVSFAYCSATPAVNFLDEKRPVSLICRLEPKVGYVGPTQLLHKPLSNVEITKDDDLSKQCVPFEEFLDFVMLQPAVKKASDFNLSRDTPQFSICQLSPWTKHHRFLEGLTHSKFPGKLNTIIYDSEEKITVRVTPDVQQYINENWGGEVSVRKNTTNGVVVGMQIGRERCI